MECPNCGLELKESEKVCPICQTVCEENSNVISNDKYEEYKENERLNEEYGFNKLLIFSILELFFCAQFFGIASLVLLFLKLKPAINNRNFEEAATWKRTIKIILIIGLIFGVLLFAGNLAVSIISELI